MKLKLKHSLACVIIDTYPNKELAKLATNQMLKVCDPKEVYVLSSENFLDGAKFFKIRSLNSMRAYESIVLSMLPAIIEEDFALLYQWDGFVLNENAFDSRFLNYDYIGAPWFPSNEDPRVGNGGFCLRSRKLLDFLLVNTLSPDHSINDGANEDVRICTIYRKEAEDYGVRFAPVEVASQFAFETRPVAGTFGFHGMFNFPLIFPESFLIEHLDLIINRTRNFNMWRDFLGRCLSVGMNGLAGAVQRHFEDNRFNPN